MIFSILVEPITYAEMNDRVGIYSQLKLLEQDTFFWV